MQAEQPAGDQPEPIPANQKAGKNKAPVKKKNSRRFRAQGGRQDSEFLAGSQLLWNDAMSVDAYAANSTSALNPSLLEHSPGIKEIKWIQEDNFADQKSDEANVFSSSAPGTISEKYVPLFPSTGKFSGSFFSPMPKNPLALMIDDSFFPSESTGHDGILFEKRPGTKGQQATRADTIGKSSETPFAYKYKMDKMLLNAGVSWVNDIVDANGISKMFKEAGFENASNRYGLNLNLGASYRAFSLTGGYIRALDTFAPTQLSLVRNETEPSAWTSEFAYTTELLHKETVLAVGYQKSLEALRLYLPEQRYTTKASMVLHDRTTLSLEYYFDKDNPLRDGSTDTESYGVTTKIGFEF